MIKEALGKFFRRFGRKFLRGLLILYFAAAWLADLIYIGYFAMSPESRPAILSAFWWTVPAIVYLIYLIGKL